MKNMAFVSGLSLLLGCSGSVVKEDASNGSTTGTGGEGAASVSSSSASGGTGGLLDVGGGGAGGVPIPEGCSVVLDEGFYVSLVVDGESLVLTNPCWGDDGYGPYAAFQYGKGGGGGFHVEACTTLDNGYPLMTLDVNIEEKGGLYASILYGDAGGGLWEGVTDTMDVPDFGEPWDNVFGTFSGKTTSADGSAHVLDGKFLLCRRPDLYAP
jgi:hypothetical protein